MSDEDSDKTAEVRERLAGDSEMDTDSDSSDDPLFTVDSGEGEEETDE